MRPKGSAAVLEARRQRAMNLLDTGLSLNAVARRLGCAPISVQRWRDARARRGTEGLKVRRSPGRPRRLSRRQEQQLLRLLLQGATAHGFGSALWTTKRIAELVARQFGVSYHHDHVGRLLRRLGWSVQRPERQARERDDDAIEPWKRQDWPRVKKTPPACGPTWCSWTKPATSSCRPSSGRGRRSGTRPFCDTGPPARNGP